MSLSEFAIFKQCVEDPSRLTKNLGQLNLQFIKDPQDIEREQSKMGTSMQNITKPTDMGGKTSPRRQSLAGAPAAAPKGGETEADIT